jgi:hypothetical protein
LLTKVVNKLLPASLPSGAKNASTSTESPTSMSSNKFETAALDVYGLPVRHWVANLASTIISKTLSKVSTSKFINQ